MSHVSTYKPSPLSFGSPRASPFRRPESPASPSPSFRPITPNVSPTKPHTPLSSPTKSFTPVSSPSKLNPNATHLERSPAVTAPSTPPTARSGNSWTPRGTDGLRNSSPTPTPGAENSAPGALGGGGRLLFSALDGGDALAKLPAAQVREMRDGFQILDRDNDGRVTREDVVDMLSNLGLDSSPSSVNAFFSSSATTTLSLPQYLSTLATPLAQLSAPAELLSAFAAFDTDDSGQIDVAELRDALMNTGGRSLAEHDVEGVLAGFRGRRAFGAKGSTVPRGEVFRYRDFVSGLGGGAGNSDRNWDREQDRDKK